MGREGGGGLREGNLQGDRNWGREWISAGRGGTQAAGNEGEKEEVNGR